MPVFGVYDAQQTLRARAHTSLIYLGGEQIPYFFYCCAFVCVYYRLLYSQAVRSVVDFDRADGGVVRYVIVGLKAKKGCAIKRESE